jgi:hypothetical protein
MLSPIRLSQLFDPIVNLPAWNVQLGHGSFLTFEFGSPSLHVGEPHRIQGERRRRVSICGEWHFWVYCCRWEIRKTSEILANSESSRTDMSAAAQFLDGQILLEVSFNPESERCRFIFDLDGALETWPDKTEPADQWMLFQGDQCVVTLDGHNEFDYSP